MEYAVNARPEDSSAFRAARLLLLFEAAHAQSAALSIRRASICDFFAASPHLVYGGDQRWKILRLRGFASFPLSDASPGHRFATRRELLTFDLSQLIARELITVSVGTGERKVSATNEGLTIAAMLTSTYADAYRESAAMLIRDVERLSETKLDSSVSAWLKVRPEMFELIAPYKSANQTEPAS